MRQLHILVVEPYPFGKICGNLKLQSYILNQTDKKKFKLHLVIPFASDVTDYLQKQGTEVIVVPPPQRLLQYGGTWAHDHLFGKLLTMLSIIPYNLKLFALLKKKKIDVIYCNCIRSLLYIALAAKLSSTPLLWYVKGEFQNKILDRVGFILANKILFFCEANKHDKYPGFVDFFERKIEILKIGLDPQEIMDAEKGDKTNLKQELSLDGKKVNIVTEKLFYASLKFRLGFVSLPLKLKVELVDVSPPSLFGTRISIRMGIIQFIMAVTFTLQSANGGKTEVICTAKDEGEQIISKCLLGGQRRKFAINVFDSVMTRIQQLC